MAESGGGLEKRARRTEREARVLRRTGIGLLTASVLAAGGLGVRALWEHQVRTSSAALGIASKFVSSSELPGTRNEMIKFGRLAALGIRPEHMRALHEEARRRAYADTSRAKLSLQSKEANLRWANAYDILESIYGHVAYDRETGRFEIDGEWIRKLELGKTRLPGQRREKRVAGIEFLKNMHKVGEPEEGREVTPESMERDVLIQDALKRLRDAFVVWGGKSSSLEQLEKARKELATPRNEGSRLPPNVGRSRRELLAAVGAKYGQSGRFALATARAFNRRPSNLGGKRL